MVIGRWFPTCATLPAPGHPTRDPVQLPWMRRAPPAAGAWFPRPQSHKARLGHPGRCAPCRSTRASRKHRLLGEVSRLPSRLSLSHEHSPLTHLASFPAAHSKPEPFAPSAAVSLSPALPLHTEAAHSPPPHASFLRSLARRKFSPPSHAWGDPCLFFRTFWNDACPHPP